MRAVDDTGHLDHTLSVLTLDGRRHLRLDYLAEVLDADSIAGTIVDDDIFNVFDAGSESRSITDSDIIFFTILSIVRAYGSAHCSTYGSSGSSGVKAIGSKFHPVEIYLILRSILVTAEGNLRECRISEHLLTKFIGNHVGGLEVVSVNLHVHGSSATHTARTFRYGTLMYFRVIAQVSTDNVGNLTGRAFTVFHTSEVDAHRNDIGAVGLHTCERVVRVCLTEGVATYLNFRNF